MKKHPTPLHELVSNGNTFLFKDNNLYLFRGFSEEEILDPSIILDKVSIPSTNPRNYREVEDAFISYEGVAESLQQKFLETILSESFYESGEITNLENAQKIAQYTLGEALPALLVAYSSLIGLNLPSKNSFIGAQDLVFSKIGGDKKTESSDDMETLYETFKEAVYEKSGELVLGDGLDITKKISDKPSILEGFGEIVDLFSIDKRLYKLNKEKKDGLQIRFNGKNFGLENQNTFFMRKYERLFETYILSRTLEDQKDFIQDLLPRARLGQQFKKFVEGSNIEFGDGDVRIGCEWLEDNLSVGHFGGRSMILYMQTPTMFVRGVKNRKDEYEHLSEDSGLVDGEFLYWKYPENKVCVFVSADRGGNLHITSPSIVNHILHTGIAGKMDSRSSKYHLMCGVQGGTKEKPLGQDAVDILGVALNYYQNGISPETVRSHTDGTGFVHNYNDCFPVGKGYTEAQVNAIIDEFDYKGREIWKANHMHLPLENNKDNNLRGGI